MKKIAFSEKYGMNQAVLERRKNMTRRIEKALNQPNIIDISEWGVDSNGKVMLSITYDTGVREDVYPRFQIGEVVAIAQTYKDIYHNGSQEYGSYELVRDFKKLKTYPYHDITLDKGWRNKMFVAAGLMPHRIRIADIKAERLQDISDEDCLKEGIMEGEFMNTWDKFFFDEWGDVPNHITFKTPRAAFAALIDRISGRGTWERNPWCFCYEFELVK